MINNYSKNKRCKCGKLICNDSDHCKHCSQTGKLNHQFTTGISITPHHCSECKKEITGRGKTGLCVKCHHLEMIGEGNPNFNKNLERHKQHYCCDCGKKIYFRSARCKSCSIKERLKDPQNRMKCGQKGNKNGMFGVHRFGEESPTWIDGRSYLPYSSDFTEELKESIRKRDNYECQNCGMTEEEHLTVLGTVLTVHHIDYTKTNSKENNLITLCNSCNIRANFNRDYWLSFYQQKVQVK